MILGPLAMGGVLLFIRAEAIRKILVVSIALFAALGAVSLAWFNPESGGAVIRSHGLDLAKLAVEMALGGYILYVSIRERRPLLMLLALAQSGLMGWFEFTHGAQLPEVRTLFYDKLSVILALINGLVGGGICVYALSYMRCYHEEAHRDVPDRRPFFFGLLVIFMGAMFGIIFCDNLLWLFLFWEITTVCSFLLIGYTQTEEARRNALRALMMNVAGGLAFAAAIVWAFHQSGVLGLQALLTTKSSLVLLPVALLCLAAMTKAAQLPFSSWLLGAMVAPTPVSALLHSSTMVKAGVYLILRLAPLLTGSGVGTAVALVGAMTFLWGSVVAITANESKKVLAYSTVANLGLIVLCGGVGTYAAVWAGVLLVIFHGVAKCLLFLCVGVVEHQLHSRDIEAMSGLLLKMPRVGVMMLVGMAGMFLAPFGMLISKWAVLKAVVDAYPALSIFIVFGSAATLFFWVKWMGKLLEVQGPIERIRPELSWAEGTAVYGLGITTFLACLLFPYISSRFIEPYVLSVYGHSAAMSPGNILIMTCMISLVLLFPLSFLRYGRGVKVMDAYLSGANFQGSTQFVGSAQQVQSVANSNYYLRNFFNEAQLSKWGMLAATAMLVFMLAASVGTSSKAASGIPTGHPPGSVVDSADASQMSKAGASLTRGE